MAWPDLSDWSFWEHLGKVAPIATALIAFGAASVAVFSLLAQIHIARRRAAIDVFLKTEMDHAMLTAFHDYMDGLEAAKQYTDIDQFKKADPKSYRAVRTYLNVNELICIGINHKAFDQRVCYGFWSDVLNTARTEGAKIIDDARAPIDGVHTYDHILSVTTDGRDQAARNGERCRSPRLSPPCLRLQNGNDAPQHCEVYTPLV